jgi:hypothetical protein
MTTTSSARDEQLRAAMARLRTPAITAAVIGLGLTGLGRALAPEESMRGYLIALLFWQGIALGALAIFMLHNLVGGAWGFVIRRMLEAALSTIPLVAILFVPVLFSLDELYLWTHHEHVRADPLLQHKAPYLNVEFFLIRFGIYFAVWIVLATLLRKWSGAQDAGDRPNVLRKMQVVSGVGLLIYAITVTFSSIDWVMSITPHWTSQIFGMIFMVAQTLTALAFSMFAAGRFAQNRMISGPKLTDFFHDLGNLLFAFVMLWTYLMMSQFLIIWSANIPEEIPWYLLRTEGSWGWMSVLLIIFHFALPILLLLLRSVKRDIGTLSLLAGYLALIGFADMAYLVSPALEAHTGPFHWVALAAWVGIGGIWVLVFSISLAQRPLIPVGDPRLPAGIEGASHVRG